MFKTPSKLLDECAKDRTQAVLTENEIALECLRHDLKYYNVNNSIKALKFSTESNLPLELVLSVGSPQYSQEGFLGEIGKSIKNRFEKVGLWFKTTKNHELAVKILSTLKPEVKQILTSGTPKAVCNKIIDSSLTDMEARASKVIVVDTDIAKSNLPGFIKRILKRVATASEYLSHDENMAFAFTISAPGYKKVIVDSLKFNASEESITAAYKLLTGTDKLPDNKSYPEFAKEVKEKLSKKSNGVRILFDVFTNPSSMKSLMDSLQNDAKLVIENGNGNKADKKIHNKEILEKADFVYLLVKDYFAGLYHISSLAADLAKV